LKEDNNMKRSLFAAVLCAGVVFSSAAFADRWITPVNGTVSAVMMPGGEVMMKLQLPSAAFEMISRDMKQSEKTCKIQEIYPDAKDTMILVCG